MTDRRGARQRSVTVAPREGGRNASAAPGRLGASPLAETSRRAPRRPISTTPSRSPSALPKPKHAARTQPARGRRSKPRRRSTPTRSGRSTSASAPFWTAGQAPVIPRNPTLRAERHRHEVDAPARRLDALDPHAHGIAEPQRLTGALAREDRALLVELPPVSAQAADRQQPLVAAGEAHERASADEPRDLAVELLVEAALEQLALQQEGACDTIGRALDRHRVALAPRRPRAGLIEVRRARRRLPRADRAEQGAVRDEVRIAPDR